MSNELENVVVGGFPTLRTTAQGLADMMVTDCLNARLSECEPKLVFSSNGQGLALAATDNGFMKTMLEADIIHADGMSVVTGSKFMTSAPLPERISTTDFFHDAARAGESAGLRFYFLGATEDINAAAYEKAQSLYPRIEWVGRRNGYFSEDEESAVCAEILATRPDVLWVGLGKPGQEAFSVRNRDRLKGIGWLKTCGGLFDFLAGKNSRAPEWMQKAGLEWAYRVGLEPRRLAWRYASTNVIAIYAMLANSERAPVPHKLRAE